MSPSSRSIGDFARFGVTFWLPPGGVDNCVWASFWAELADLRADDVDPVLELLAEADIGGYVATPGGGSHRRGGSVIHRLWVDSMQYRRAEDVLMAHLRGR